MHFKTVSEPMKLFFIKNMGEYIGSFGSFAYKMRN